MTSDGKSSLDCATAQRYLSAFHDGELAPNLRTAVGEHIEGCPECAARLSDIRELSRMAAELPTPAVAADIWPQLEKKLASQASDRSTASSNLRIIGRRRVWISVAAVALVVVTVSTAAVVWFHEQGHQRVAVNFDRYLDEFERNPDAAQQVLLSNYEGRAVSYDEAATKVLYEPVTTERLPSGLSRKVIYLLRMPCCTCVQAIYQREDGEKLAVFEHVDDQPVWFGNRPAIKTRCNGMSTSLVQVDDHLAATWRQHGRYVTVVGANDMEQVAQLMTFLHNQAETK